MNSQQIPQPAPAEDPVPGSTTPAVEEPAQKAASAEKATTPANLPTNEVVEDDLCKAPVEPTAPVAEEVLYCICRSKDETAMVQCDKCNEWFHFRCMGIVTQEQVEAFNNKPFYCGQKQCLDKERALKKKGLKKAKKQKPPAASQQTNPLPATATIPNPRSSQRRNGRGENENDSNKPKSKPARRRNDEDGSSGKEAASGEPCDESEATRAKARNKKPTAKNLQQQYNLRKSEKPRTDQLPKESATGQENSIAPSAHPSQKRNKRSKKADGKKTTKTCKSLADSNINEPMTKPMPGPRPPQSFMPFMFPAMAPMSMPYPMQQPPMMGGGQPAMGTSQVNNNIMSLIYNFQHLNNHLSLTITHVKLLAQYNKLKKTLLTGDSSQPKITAQTSMAKPPETKRQRTETTHEQPLPEQLAPFSMESEVVATEAEKVIVANGPGKVEAVFQDSDNETFVWSKAEHNKQPGRMTALGTQLESSAAESRDGDLKCSFVLKRRDMYLENHEQNDEEAERHRMLQMFAKQMDIQAPADACPNTLENLLQSKISSCQKSHALSSP